MIRQTQRQNFDVQSTFGYGHGGRRISRKFEAATGVHLALSVARIESGRVFVTVLKHRLERRGYPEDSDEEIRLRIGSFKSRRRANWGVW